MKIGRIEIKNLNQFHHIELDLTYPKGHPKAGQPLDKVCFIGQNGTGKTTLLELIADSYIVANVGFKTKSGDSILTNIGFLPTGASVCLDYLGTDDKKVVNRRTATNKKIDSNEYYFVENDGEETEALQNNNNTYFIGVKSLTFIPFGINSSVFLDKQYNDNISDFSQEIISKYFHASPATITAFEKYTFKESQEYKKNNADYKLHLINRLESGEKLDLLEELKKWEDKNPNPLPKIAVYLDKLLNRFFLRTKTTLDSTDEIASIQLESMVTHETIPIEYLSSGTRQILNTARPLYNLMKEKSIVLIDEPETSLYPDLQREIIPYYTTLREDLAGKVQYFFATHSPIVASSFDPWEIVDLEFDENGRVVRHLYYEGENHVDNYTISPKYLRWDSILNKVFDVKASGDAHREKAITELAGLNTKLDYWKKEGLMANPTEDMKKDIKRYKHLLALMDWKPTNDVNL